MYKSVYMYRIVLFFLFQLVIFQSARAKVDFTIEKNDNEGAASTLGVPSAHYAYLRNYALEKDGIQIIKLFDNESSLVKSPECEASSHAFLQSINKVGTFYTSSMSQFFPLLEWNPEFASEFIPAVTSGKSFILSGGSISPSTQMICVGTRATFTGDAVSGATYQWQLSTQSTSAGFTDVSGATSQTLTTPIITQTTYVRRVTTVGGSQFFSNVATVNVTQSITWNSSTATSLHTKNNYTPLITPANITGCNVVIPTGTRQLLLTQNLTLNNLQIGNNRPIITSPSTSSFTLSVNNLQIGENSIVTLNSSSTLTVQGQFINFGAIEGTGELNFNGSASQLLSGNGSARNVRVNNPQGVQVESSSELNIFGELRPQQGTITANGNLILKSTEFDQATIYVIPGCNPTRTIFIGDIVLEKFIPEGQRAIRFITPGATTTTSINENWQEGSVVSNPRGYPNFSGDGNPRPSFGTHITGSTIGDNGFDATITGNPSMFTYNNLSQQWGPVSNTNQRTFKVGEAYQILVRGDRSIDLTKNDPPHTATTLRTKGVPAVCDYVFNTSSTVPLSSVNEGWSFIGNPYWAVVDWGSVEKTGIKQQFYYWDPTISGSNNRGGYVNLIINGSGYLKNILNSRASRYLQPGQGIFVRNMKNATNPQIVFKEEHKIAGGSNRTNVFGHPDTLRLSDVNNRVTIQQSNSDQQEELLYISLFLKDNVNSSPADGVVLSYNPANTNAISEDDVIKLNNPDENIAFRYQNQNLGILSMRSEDFLQSDTLPLRLWNLSSRDYVLRIDLRHHIPANREIFLLNRATKEKINLPLGGIFDYAFKPSGATTVIQDFVLVYNSAPIKDYIGNNTLQVIPNPVLGNKFKIILPNDLASTGTFVSVEIFTQSGVKQGKYTGRVEPNKTIQVSTRSLLPGTYIIRLLINGKTFATKFVQL